MGGAWAQAMVAISAWVIGAILLLHGEACFGGGLIVFGVVVLA